MVRQIGFPPDWDEEGVRNVLAHYEEQTEEDAVAEAALVKSHPEVNVTDLLMKSFDAASRLPEEEQDAVAEWLLAELQSEEEWERRFARTQDPCRCVTVPQAVGEFEKSFSASSPAELTLP